jgi:hypothetical protein
VDRGYGLDELNYRRSGAETRSKTGVLRRSRSSQ